MCINAIQTFQNEPLPKSRACVLAPTQAALPHGGIRSEDVRNTLEHCRSGIGQSALNKGAATPTKKVENPHLFAHELAFVIERSGAGTDELSNQVLILYLEGVASLPLAVEYAERNVRQKTFVEFRFVVQLHYAMINGSRWKAIKW